jgi:hypothetical protein
MFQAYFKYCARSVLSVALLIGGTLHPEIAQAVEKIIGQVTGIDVASKSIKIDGASHVISPNVTIKQQGRFAPAKKMSDIKPGQTVLFETEHDVIRSITLIDGPVPK